MRGRLLVGVAAFVIAAAAGALVAGRDRGDPSQSRTLSRQPRLAVDPNTLSFGEVWDSDRLTWTIRVTNPSDRAVKVSSWRTSCDCFQVTPATATVEAGQTVAVSLVFDLTRQPAGSDPEAPRDVTFTLRPRYEDEPTDDGEEWRVTGRVRPYYRVLTGTQFGPRSELTKANPAEAVGLRYLLPVKDVRLGSVSGGATGRVVPLADGREVRVEVTWPQGLGVGGHDQVITVLANSAEGEALPPVRLSCRLNVAEDAQLSAAKLALTPPPDGGWVEDEVEVYSLAGQKIESVRLEDGLHPDVKTSVREDRFIRVQARRPTGAAVATHTIPIRVVVGGKAYTLELRVLVV
jgi:hypothetical protein